MYYRDLANTAFSYPAIDNHAHPFLAERHRDEFPLEGLNSEATGDALMEDSIHTLAFYRSTTQLIKLFRLKGDEATWDSVKRERNSLDYVKLCETCMKPSGIQCLLLDDGLACDVDLPAEYKWHDQFTVSPTKRIVRIEVEAQNLMLYLIQSRQLRIDEASIRDFSNVFTAEFEARITSHANNTEVVSFKSVVCYRTGLDIATSGSAEQVEGSILEAWERYKEKGDLRFEHKALNDHLVRIVLRIAGECKKPVQFHTGLGDSEITLTKSSPAHMQPIIKTFPETIFVLLHSSYPYTRDAGYLTSVYRNVYLDFGEIFPLVSADGQCATIRQMLELSPTNKILWSTDGHWWPESFYLASIQSRQALYEVLADCILREELSEEQAVMIIQNALFHNSNRIYRLGLTPKLDIIM